jgi:hypothetical protein
MPRENLLAWIHPHPSASRFETFNLDKHWEHNATMTMAQELALAGSVRSFQSPRYYSQQLVKAKILR